MRLGCTTIRSLNAALPSRPARTGKGAKSVLGLTPCGPGYWLLTGAGFAWLLGVALVGGRRLVGRAAQAEAAGVALLPGDVRWDGQIAAHCLMLALLAGVVAGVVGVGGGMVLGPMMLELSVLPQVGRSWPIARDCTEITPSYTATPPRRHAATLPRRHAATPPSATPRATPVAFPWPFRDLSVTFPLRPPTRRRVRAHAC